VHFSNATVAAEWVYIADSSRVADLILFVDDPRLATPRVIACVLEYLQKKEEENQTD
tara:strand:- start:290 stop:460 length:171 start_codon:yes stop_codon:yes gene_type:complete